LRKLFTLLAALSAVGALAGSASAGEDYVCWHGEIWDPHMHIVRDILICRIDGVIVDDGSPGTSDPLPPLVYDLGYDTVGECYYQRTGPWAGWIPLAVNGTQILFAWDPDGIPGGPFVADVWVEQCISEPTPGEPPRTLVYRVVENFFFAEPNPEIVPNGIGLTGAATHLYVDPPPPVIESVVSPVGAGVIDVEIKVITVTIDWGDGTEVSIPESRFGLFAPHPDGDVVHVWETKANYSMEVDYNWYVRWRVNGGAWNVMSVPATNWSAPYQVDEIVGRRSG
jgi:hypothetical protein